MTEPRMSGTKRCSRCGEEKPVLAFAVDKRRPDGLQCACRACRSKEEAESPRAHRLVAERKRRRIAGRSFPKDWDF